jgi:rhodanese-related sulfurtransferase
MLRRLVNLPFAVATRAAKAFQDHEDAKTREKYGPTKDPGQIDNPTGRAGAPLVEHALDAGAVRIAATDVVAAQKKGRNVVLVDIRESRTGEAPAGSLHMPLSEVSIRVSELSDDQLVVAFGGDDAALQAVSFFRERGIEDAWVLGGGIPAWKAAGGRTEAA